MDNLFEQFLDSDRYPKDLPDIDRNFSQEAREEAIKHLKETYSLPIDQMLLLLRTMHNSIK